MESKTGPLENDVMLTVVNPDESREGSSKGTLLLYGFAILQDTISLQGFPGAWNWFSFL